MSNLTTKSNYWRSKAAEYPIWALLGINVFSVFVVSLYLVNDFYYLKYNDLLITGKWMFRINASIIVLHYLLNLISYLTFIRWFYRAYTNLHVLKTKNLYARGWVIGAWFIPIVNWFLPYRIMRNLVLNTLDEIGSDDASKRKQSVRILNNWWAWWIVISIMSILVFVIHLFMFRDSNIIHVLLAIIVSFLGVITCITTIKLIRHYRLLERQLVQKFPVEKRIISDSGLLDS